MTLKLLLLFCVILKQTENFLIDVKTIEIHPSKKINKEVGAIQTMKCIIKKDIDLEDITPNGTNAVFYHISCEKATSIEVIFKIAKTNGTANETTKDRMFIDCEHNVTNINATILNVNAVEVHFSSMKPNIYVITCKNEKDKVAVYNRVQFGYRPNLASIHIEKDVFDFISIYITPGNFDDYWSITCQSSKMKSKWYPCDRKEFNETWWRLNGSRQIFFSFNITGINQYGIYSKVHNYSNWKIPVRLPAFENITKTVSKYSIQLSLNLSSIPIVVMLQKQYKVLYRCERDPPGSWKIKRSSSQKITLNNLHPFTNYSVLASAKETSSTIWNKNVTLIIKTRAAAPSSSPRTTDGCYVDLICPSSKRKCFTVFWQSLPLEFRNDILTGYCVQYIGESLSTSKTDQCLDSNNLTVGSLYKDFQDLPKNQTLTFSIVAVTKSRRMSQPTFIRVKNTVTTKPKAVYVIQISDKIYNVSWLLEQPQKVVNVTVFWCQNKVQSSNIRCKDHVKWNTVVNASYLLVNYNFEHLPVFAAYVNTEEGSSSLTKAECVFTPGKPTKPQQPNIIWSETKFSLTWPKMLCSDWNGIPVAYVLRYAEGKRCEIGKKKEFPVKGIKAVEDTVVISELKPETEYSVCIQVKTKEEISLMSKAITETTKDTDDRILIIIIFLTIIGVAVIFGIYGLIWKCRKFWRKYEFEYVTPSNNYENIQNAENENKGEPLTGDDTAMPVGNTGNMYNTATIEPQKTTFTGSDSEETSTENTSETNVMFNSTTPLLPNILQDNIIGYTDEAGNCFKEPMSPESVPTCVNGYLLENVSNETCYVDEQEDCLTTPISNSIPTCVNGYMEEKVFNGTSYVDLPGYCFTKYIPNSIPTCVNGNLEENDSNGTGYVDGPEDCFIERMPESVPTCVNGNSHENVLNGTRYVDEPGDCLTKPMPNSVPTFKNVNSNGSIPDYILSEPIINDNISQSPEQINSKSTNSHESKPLKGLALQTEGKENNQKETTKFKGKADEKNVQRNFSVSYNPHEDIVKVMKSSSDENKDKNTQEDRQGISQNPVGSCDLINNNVHKTSDSLQKETTEDNLKTSLQTQDKKTDILQETDTSDYVKTESYYLSNP